MAIWRITESLAVTYEARGRRQDCGTAKDSSLPDVEGWAVCEASPWDLVISPSGRYVRLISPRTRA